MKLGRASFTLIGRPLSMVPPSAEIAPWASVDCVISTKAMPPGFARIPVLDDGDGFDCSVGCKQFPQLLLRHRDIRASDKNVSHEFILFLIFPKSRNQE